MQTLTQTTRLSTLAALLIVAAVLLSPNPCLAQEGGIHVDESGEVGISTEAPTTDLHVDGKLQVGSGAPPSWSVANFAGAGQQKLRVHSSNENTAGYILFSGRSDSTWSTGGGLMSDLLSGGGRLFLRYYGTSENGNGWWADNMIANNSLELHFQPSKHAFNAPAWGGAFFHTQTVFHDSVGVGTRAPSEALEVDGTVLAGSVQEASSRRWKENVRPIEKPLRVVQRLEGVRYEWKEDGTSDVGLIAEEVGEVLPSFVSYEENGVDAKGIDYARLTAILIEAVKSQQQRAEAQQMQLEAQRKRLDAFEEIVNGREVAKQ